LHYQGHDWGPGCLRENVPVSQPIVKEPTLHPLFLQRTVHASSSQLHHIENEYRIAHQMKDVSTQTERSEREPEGSMLQEMLLKLNSMESNHNKQMADANKQIRLLRTQLEIMSNRLVSRPGLVPENNFEWEPISSKQDLEKFEEKLKEVECNTSFKEFLENILQSERSEARLHDSMDVIFKRDFVTKLSWTGGGKPDPKIRFLSFINILKLYKHGVMPTDKKLKEFFQNKFKHGNQRLNLTGTVKSTFHRHR
uniref:DUF4806 domain-containing protein n=1 Tax=Anopheles atroparvus TaxID=41427 RepID=A0A182IK80_ANOAO